MRRRLLHAWLQPSSCLDRGGPLHTGARGTPELAWRRLVTLACGVDTLGHVSARIVVVLAVLAGCGGKAGVGTPQGPPEGRCSASGSLWSCVADDAGASPDGATPTLLSDCPPGVGTGSCTGGDQTVGTSNPTQPVHITNGDCLQCASNGLGTYWSCPSGSWQAQGVYSCP